VYTIHQSIGHLGLFVSSGVARKEHSEFSSNIDLIDVLPPGLYEAVIEPKTDKTLNPDLAATDWVMRCEARTLDDIRALGGNDAADERRFATAAKVSEINLALYRTFIQPSVRNVFAPVLSEWIRASHPLRLQYEIFDNPWMASLQPMARWAQTHRQKVEPDNPILAVQEAASHGIVNALDAWRDFRDTLAERTFLAVYGSPLLQANLGIDPFGERPSRKAGKSTLHRQFVQTRIAELKSRIRVGGLRESVVRAMLYVGISRGAVDERAFEAIRRLRAVTDGGPHMTLAEFKAMVREQFFMLLIDEDAAIAAIPALLPQDAESRRTGFALLRSVLSTSGDITGESATRLQRIAKLMGIDAATTSPSVAA
jgi:Protein of unknown function (DUF3141)